LRHRLLQTPGEEITKRRKKMIFPNLPGIIFLFSAIYRTYFNLFIGLLFVYILLFLLYLFYYPYIILVDKSIKKGYDNFIRRY
jgi:hypothetical protein